jgi:D-tyrosyl-tRNA(Tyr) deacylase
MRVVVQRVVSASVSVAGENVAAIGRGLLVFAGVGIEDTADSVGRMAEKVAGLRIFDDQAGRLNLTPGEAGAEVLCISQFTLFGDVRRGRRPSFARAAPGPVAQPLYDSFCEAIERAGLHCARGVFGAEMLVSLVNDGPVTLVIDSEDLEQPRRA